LRDGAVRSEKIASGAVTSAKIGEAQVIGSRIKDNSITNEKIARNAVTTDKIVNGSVTPAKLSFTPPSAVRPITPPVTTDEIAGGAVSAEKLATNAVTTEKIANGAVTPEKLSGGFVKYVPRAVATWDKTRMNFEFDGVLHEDGMDLSAIVPAGAIATHLIIEVSGPQGEAFQIYANQGAKICNSFIGFIQGMGGGLGRVHCVIYNDPDRLFDYLLTPGIGDVVVAVAGWYV
jgi:hypothetical protein